MNEKTNTFNLNPNNKKPMPTQEQISLKREVEATINSYGFRYIKANIDRQGEELLQALFFAIDNPELEASERLQEVYQIACNLKANRSLYEAINQTIYDGSTQEEVNKLQDKN